MPMSMSTPTPPLSDELDPVLADVRAERERQVTLGYTPQHDDRHHLDLLMRMALVKVNAADDVASIHGELDPDLRRLLVQGTALLVATLESLDRRIDSLPPELRVAP